LGDSLIRSAQGLVIVAWATLFDSSGRQDSLRTRDHAVPSSKRVLTLFHRCSVAHIGRSALNSVAVEPVITMSTMVATDESAGRSRQRATAAEERPGSTGQGGC